MKNIIFSIAAVVLFATAMFAQGSIEGKVTDSRGKGVASVTVTVYGADGKSVAFVTTEADGTYSFDEIAAGKYKLVASNEYYQEPAIRDEVMVEDDDIATVDISMGVMRSAPPPPEAAPATKYTGVVLSFNSEKGYGYIKIDGTHEQLFVHITGLIDQPINVGDKVEFEIKQTKKGKSAIMVKKM